MLDLLKLFLFKNTSQEYMAMFITAIETLYKLGMVSFEADFITLLTEAYDEESVVTILRLEDTLNKFLDQAIVAQGIATNDTISISVRTAILEGLRVLQNFNDNDRICQICESGLDPIETLSELLALVTPLHATEYHMALVSVNSKVIETLEEIAERDFDFTTESKSKISDAIKERIRTWIGMRKSFATSLIQSGISPGLSVAMYIQLMQDDPHAVFGDDKDRTAAEVLGLVLISDVPNDQIRPACQRLLDEFYPNIDYITAVDMEIDQLLMEVFPHG